MDMATYCSKVCGGKCCKVPAHGVQCPMLNSDNLCSIYKERYEQGVPYSFVIQSKTSLTILGEPRQFKVDCGRIEDIIAAGKLSKDVLDQCAWVNRSLLETATLPAE